MDIYIPLDPRPDATEITDLQTLRSAEVGVTMNGFSVKEIKSMAIDPNAFTIGEMDFSNARIAANLIVGDEIVKVNDEKPINFVHLSKMLASSGEITMIIKRRAFVTPPGHTRVQAAMAALKLSIQKKCSYQVVTCKKMPYDIFLASSFGFTAENVTVEKKIKKFVVAEINVNTAAEKYFSVGDVLIDFRGLPIHNDGATLKQFNVTFQTVGEIDVLIERPVPVKSREATAALIKSHLLKHDTPAMCDEVTKIGLLAGRYHKLFWSRLTPVPINVPIKAGEGAKNPAIPAIPDINTKPEAKSTPPEKKAGSKEARSKASSAEKPNLDQGKRTKSKANRKDSKKSKNPTKKTARGKKSTKRNKKNNSNEKTKDRSEETKDLSVEATTMDKDTTVGDNDPANNRVKIVGAKSFQEITSDVDPGTELESIGLRYTDDFEDENTQDDEDQKKMKRARRALRPIKKGLFSTMALFKKQEKEK